MQEISNVSDTARWVAAYRAQESARPDALFNDPFAARLAGPRGFEIAANMPSEMRRHSWPMVVRTQVIDELIATSLREGADVVINMAAGLDTRPYRLPLPQTLRWVEADLPAMVDEKERLLSGETPRCELVRERVDLADAEARRAFLDRALAGKTRALVITEGLLIYLGADAVRGLASDLAARREIEWWMLDLASPGILKMIKKQTRSLLQGSAEMRFAPTEGVAFFSALGWKALEVRSMLREGVRLRRVPRLLRIFSFFPDPPADRPGNRPWTAVVRFRRHRD
jgi:methyltransferase (TIGR00027 family)